jgi:DNA-binding NarL/FixJ family response regulator
MMSKTITILLADHYLMIREGLKCLLNVDKRFNVVDETDNSADTLQTAKKLKPDIVMLDANLSGMTSFDIITRIREMNPKTRIIVMAFNLKQVHVRKALQAGAHGYISKTSSFKDLAEAIEMVQNGRRYLSQEIVADIIQDFASEDAYEKPLHYKYRLLTSREKEVFNLLVSGNSAEKIGQILNINAKTVYKHRNGVMEKLNIHNIAELTRFAIEVGVIDADSDDTDI